MVIYSCPHTKAQELLYRLQLEERRRIAFLPVSLPYP
jgi:hypothetical protein